MIVLECEPGDPTAELRHLKQPAEPVGPLALGHDHTADVTALFDDRPDLLSLLITAGSRYHCRRRGSGSHRPRSAERLEDDHSEAQQARGPGSCDQSPGRRTSHGAEPDRWYASTLANWRSDASEHWTDAIVPLDSRLKDATGHAAMLCETWGVLHGAQIPETPSGSCVLVSSPRSTHLKPMSARSTKTRPISTRDLV